MIGDALKIGVFDENVTKIGDFSKYGQKMLKNRMKNVANDRKGIGRKMW